jgi:hypothetical protein
MTRGSAFTQPRLGAFVMLSFALAITLAFALDLPRALIWRLAPERYLAGATAYFGRAIVSDEDFSETYAPEPLLAWRRLVRSNDTAAFRRLAASGSPAGRLYGFAGLQALSPSAAGYAAPRVRAEDSVYVNADCREARLPLAEAFRRIGTPDQARLLLRSPTTCP